jgi:drug/metabolite transporter (DMT)-like permease
VPERIRPVAVLLGILVAAGYGSSDFLGGIVSRRATALAVLSVSQVVAIAVAAAVSVVAGGHVYGGDLAFGAAAGVLNVAAIGCLYRGLAIGQMGQVAPIAAVVGAVIPVVWGLARGERPGVPALVGIGLAIVAAALLSSERDERHGPLVGQALLLALAAGIGFGVSLILFAAASHHKGFWPVMSSKCAALVAVWLTLVAAHRLRTITQVPRLQAGSAGLLEVSASLVLLVALRDYPTAIVAPLASLAPGFTSFHAWWHLHERTSRVQMLGLAFALVALGLIATAS